MNKIPFSIFETNTFLLDKNPTLIEYSAFYGSIQIFQYLKLNGIELTSSLWFYAIHGRNPEIIHILEENGIDPENNDFEKILDESIKCHHNEIAKYIQNKYFLINENETEKSLSYGFHYYNYKYIPKQYNKRYFSYLCQYNYIATVEFLIKNHELNEIDNEAIQF